MTTYSSFSSIGVSTPFLMKRRGMEIALRGYNAHSPPTATSDIDDHREQSRGLPRPRGLLFLPLGLVPHRQAEKTVMVNTRPIPPLSRDPDLQTGMSRLALVPTRRSTSGLGTSGAAASRNGAARVGSQAPTARKAPPGRRLMPASAAQISHVPGLSDRYLKLVSPRQLVAYSLRDVRGRRYALAGNTSVLRDIGFCLVGRPAIGSDSGLNPRLPPRSALGRCYSAPILKPAPSRTSR